MAKELVKVKVGYVYHEFNEKGQSTGKFFRSGEELTIDTDSKAFKGQKWKFEVLSKSEEVKAETPEAPPVVEEKPAEEISEKPSTKNPAKTKKSKKTKVSIKTPTTDEPKATDNSDEPGFPESSKDYDFDSAEDDFLEAWAISLSIPLSDSTERASIIEKIKERV